jgi:cytochrome P450
MIDLAASFGDELHDVLRGAALEGPLVADSSSGAVVVLRYADVERLAHDPRLAGVGLSFFDFMGISDGPLRDWYGGLMFTNEGVEHSRLRSLVSRAFTPRAVSALRDRAAALTAGALAPIASDGGGDLVAALGRVPIRVMCHLIGVPDGDVEQFGGWADDLSPIFGVMDADQIAASTAAIGEMLAYCEGLAASARGKPGSDLITALLAAEHEGDRLTHAELVSMVANLIVGGHDTTASQLGCTLLTLLRHTGEAARLRHDPDLLSSAVSETMRYEPSIPAVPRTCTDLIGVGDTELAPGTIVLLSTAAANREPGVWADPDVVDVGRFTDPRAPRLLSFGAGVHYCLGAALARLTVEEVVRGVLALGPTIEPAEDPWQLPWRSVLGRAPARVPVTL